MWLIEIYVVFFQIEGGIGNKSPLFSLFPFCLAAPFSYMGRIASRSRGHWTRMYVLRVTYSRIFSVCPEECRKISALTNGQVLLVSVRLQLLSLSHFGEREMEGFFLNSSLFMSCHLFTIYLPFFFFSLLYRLAIGGEPCPVIRITHQLLVNALQETRPSVSPSERKRYERMYNERELTEDRCSFVLVHQTN